MGERVEAGRRGGARGHRPVSSGSRIAALAIRYGEKITVLRRLASSVTTPLRPTSLPVPAVVGSAIIGGTFGGDVRVAADGVVVLDERPLVTPGRALRRMSLPTSSGDPPPSATMMSAPRLAKGGDAVVHVLLDRIGVDPGKRTGRDAGRAQSIFERTKRPALTTPNRSR